MGKINILPPEIADKIAAGEVVERPASVVKELMENAVDAGSIMVEIRVEDAGRKRIRVSDNGEGMPKDDLERAVLRHATSKIRTSADLERIMSLGFRGEALASIAAISLLRISSRAAGETGGWSVDTEAGVVKNLIPEARTPGTTVEVRNLFFNTPARLKFLKSKATELFHIVRAVTDLSLAYPGLTVRLYHNDEELINAAGQSDIRKRIAQFLGGETAQDLIPARIDLPALRINGYIAIPGRGQSNRNNQYLFVNRRPVVSRAVQHAIARAYQSFTAEKEYPPYVLFFETPPQAVDVNVHPAKREIRFRDTNTVHDIVCTVIQEALKSRQYLPAAPRAGESAANFFRKGETAQPAAGPLPPGMLPELSGGVYPRDKEIDALFAASVSEGGAEAEYPDSRVESGQSPAVLQIKNTYLVQEDKDGIVIIDQHAAHERIIFDELLGQFKKKSLEIQKLLLPVNLSLSRAQIQLIREHLALFRGLGFEIEPFGKDSFAVHAYPAVLGAADIAAVIQNSLAETAPAEAGADVEKKICGLLAPLACHAAVRAQDRLGPEQIKSLLKRLARTDSPRTCPHGRPVMFRLTWRELEKRFKRT